MWVDAGAENCFVFLKDFKHAYRYDEKSGRAFHYVCRESYMPPCEEAQSANTNHPAHPAQNEFIYGLGETKGPMMKAGKRYIIEGRDSLAADPEETDPLYKLCPFYSVYNAETRFWYGLYYNTLSPSIFDLGGEHDFSTGNFRSFSAEQSPLDYYVLLGSHELSGNARLRPSLPGIVSQLAHLVTPHHSGALGDTSHGRWQASPHLPPLSQFGYLASSLTLSERSDAQAAVIDYVAQTRARGFPIDGMHLSSGYCQDAVSGDRNYFTWDRSKYPDPEAMGKELEQGQSCQLIINVKPWLLESHPWYDEAAREGAFVRAAPDARPLEGGSAPTDADRCGPHHTHPARTLHWSVNMGDTGKGSYFDFSSVQGCQSWQRMMQRGVLDNNITGLWIDNNEFSTLVDDDEELAGQVAAWSSPFEGACDVPIATGLHSEADAMLKVEVQHRMGGSTGDPLTVGTFGRGVLTMGMARATAEHLLRARPHARPVVVTRSFVPGMQTFAHGSWSGDNSTTWKSLKWSTKMTLSTGISFGPGLYGHDIGGFAGAHSPSPELLVRWCQQALWHTRFTVHSWKKISTTLWMYDHVPDVGRILREVVKFRYQLIPTLYSLYVTDYHRRGWPVLKPLLWHHSYDRITLTQDEQFLLGSHLLIAPNTTQGATSVEFHLPGGQIEPIWWCNIHTGVWTRTAVGGADVTEDAALDCCPALMRAGGILVLASEVGQDALSTCRSGRTVSIYPAPIEAATSCSGSFVVIEDDGCSNAATTNGEWTEYEVFFQSSAGSQTVQCGFKLLHGGFEGNWDLTFNLPRSDTRRLMPSGDSAQVANLTDDGLQIRALRIEERLERPGLAT
ncbi:alpha-glucosidase [Ceraceosorus bombacis]|uniref:Alpha-glucosidase n=1 Tax=Ceraceosorus bombacis TaxID=401625 RepID=A0A0N7L8T1_9BASI|nr:alpha-glucosidase [Ceraceosorus bombacis]